MELALIKLLAYTFTGVVAALIILIIAIALFLNAKIERYKE
jgi:hypothetical protein